MFRSARLAKPCLVFSLLAALIGAQAFADVNPDDNLQLWTPVLIQGHLSGKVPVALEIQPRTTLAGSQESNPSHFSINIVRPAIGYRLNKHVSVWQGYAWAPSFNPEFRNENRIFQQVLVDNGFKRFSLTNRTRLEERWIENTEGQTSVRARHLVRVAVPLDKQKKWGLIGAAEPFFNLNSVPNGPQAGFDQGRLFVGINRKINSRVTVETGYLNNYVNRKAPVRDRLNHAIVLGLTLTLH